MKNSNFKEKEGKKSNNEFQKNDDNINRKNNNNKNEIYTTEFPEAIVNYLLNKIISFVIQQTEIKKVYMHLDIQCFKYLKYLLNPYLSTEYIFYEDGIDDINFQQKKMFYKAPIPKKVNSWVAIGEPDSSIIDRYSSTISKVVSFKKETNENSKKELIDIKSGIKKSTAIDDNLIVNESIEYSIRNTSIRMPSIRNISSQINNNDINNDTVEENENDEIIYVKKDKNKKEEEKILALPCVDLPKGKYENIFVLINSNEENNILRKERENFIIKQAELKALQEENDKKNKLKRYQSRLQRNFDGSHQTFDPDGNVINIRPPHPSNFISEFKTIKIPIIKIKDFENDRRKSILNKNRLRRAQSIFSKNKINILAKNDIKKNNLDIESQQKSEDIKAIFNYIKKVLLPKWQKKKEFYEDIFEEEKDEEKERKKFFARKSFKDFFGPFLQKYIFKNKVDRNPVDIFNNNHNGFLKYENAKGKIILPSGSNFNIFRPEIGVVIENKSKESKLEIKDGGFNFSKKYNKPSIYEYSKLLSETSNLNSKIISTGLIESKINEINEINNLKRNSQKNKEELNYNGYMLEFSDNNNPLFQGALSSINVNDINDKSDKNDNGNKIKYKGRNYLKSMEIKLNNNKYNSMNIMNMYNKSIQLTNKLKLVICLVIFMNQ